MGCNVTNLKIASEHLSVLRGMLNREQLRVKSELELAIMAKNAIDETIYELTGDEFYRNYDIEGAESENQSITDKG